MAKLGIHVNGKPKEYSRIDALNDPQKEIDNAENSFFYTKNVKTFVTPFVESNFLEILIPSFLGAKRHTAPGGLIDVKPVFKDIYDTQKINEIDIFSGEMENAIRHLTYIKNNAPEYLYVNPTRIMAPLDYAVVLMGSEFYTSLCLEPELSLEFMQKLTDVTVKTIIELKKIVGQPITETVTPQGYIFNGIRLTGDSVVNLSPNMIKEYICPFYKQFKEKFGNVMLHYCTRPASSTHVIGALSDGGGVDWVDNNWHGIESLINEEDYIKTCNINACVSVDKDVILHKKLHEIEFFNSKRQSIVSTRCENIGQAEAVIHNFNNI